MRSGSDEQSAAALPFRTQAGIDERVRTGDCYRNAGSYQKECHDAERSQLSPDEIHEHSSRFDVQSLIRMCAQTIIAPSRRGFTISQFGRTTS